MLALVLAATLSIEDYATMPQVSTPRWSPDGKRVAYVLTRADLARSAYDADVRLVNADGTADRALTSSEASDNNPRWSPDGRTIAFLSGRGGKDAIYLIDPDGGEARLLTNEPTAIRELKWSPDGKSIAFTRPDAPGAEEERRAKEKDDARVVGENLKHAHLHVVDVATGRSRPLSSGGLSTWGFDWTPDGRAIVFDGTPKLGLDGLFHTDLYSVSLADGRMKPLVVRPGLDARPAVSPDGSTIAFTTGGGVHSWLAEHDIHVVPIDGGAPRMISASYGRTPEAIFWSDDSRAVWFEGPLDTTSQLFRVRADGSGFANVTKFEGLVTDADVRGGRAVFVRQSLTAPPEVFAGEIQLTSHNAAYRERTLGETRVIRWKNPKDGLEIEGLLTLPVGYRPGDRVPLVTFIHGGPASHHYQGFIGYLGQVYAPQVLAASGIAMLRPNPRGSGGYGVTLRRANLRDWGGMDWLDISAGIDHVIAAGIADPQRLGLSGWSYGGYLAAWALGQTDRFRAVSIGAAPVDLLSYHLTSDIRDFIPAYFPHPVPVDLLRERSPLWQVKKTGAKVLIQHGENDERVPLAQGLMLYRRLLELGVDVTMVTYPRSAHGTREPKLRMDLMRRNVELFEEAFGVRQR